MPSRKRSFEELHDPPPAAEAPKEPSLLQRIRNTWQFANLCQWLMIFGDAVKIGPIDVDDLEAECLRPGSIALQEIGLSLLKYLSSHRGLTHGLFDEYTWRQFDAKASDKPNPMGEGEVADKFSDFDVFKKIRVLHQMTELIMLQPEKLREKMSALKDADRDTSWRIEPYGWDRDDREYYVLDDNRIYRLSEPPKPPKKNTKKAKAAARASKRRRQSRAVDSAAEDAGDEGTENETERPIEPEDNGLGGKIWQCVAVSLEDVRQLIGSLNGKDANETVLRKQIQDHVLPILEEQETRRHRKEKERERELLNLEKMANAKRSSRLASKAEHQRQEEMQREEEQQRLLEFAEQKKAEQVRRKAEKERDNRLMSREKRLRERALRRDQHEQELAQLSEDSRQTDSNGRSSSRRIQAEIEKRKQAIQELDEEEEEWSFDCVCGLYGQVDDGQHSVACERCNVWQHSKCLGIKKAEAERDDFHFICDSCRRQQERFRPRIKIKLKGPGSPASDPVMPQDISVDITPRAQPTASSSTTPSATGVSPANAPGSGLRHPGSVLPPPAERISIDIPIKNDESARRNSVGAASGPQSNGLHNPFSSPHPALSPPHQSPNKARAYGTIHGSSSPVAQLNGGNDSHAPVTSHKMMQLSSGKTRKLSNTPIFPPTLPSAANGHPGPSKVHAGSPPLKPQLSSPTKKSPILAPAAALSPDGSRRRLATPTSSGVTPLVMPQQGHTQDLGRHPDPHQASSPLLPPTQGGLSPTKHSPPPRPSSQGQPGPNGLGSSFRSSFGPGSSPTPPVLPPVAALSPSPRAQNLAPPVKTAGLPQPQISSPVRR